MNCKECGARFHKAITLARHVKLAHPKKRVDTPPQTKIEEPTPAPSFSVNYCPNCGVHLDKIDLF